MLTPAMLTPRSHGSEPSAIGRRWDCHGTLRLHRRLLRERPPAVWRGVFRRRRGRARLRSKPALDVGAGPGILSIGFAPYCREVVGVDPEPGMVEAARTAAERARVAVRFIEGRFEDLAPKLGAFDIVTIGRAIHWLDPEPAREALDLALAARGRVLVWGGDKRQGRAQPMARYLQRGARSLEGRSPGARSRHILRQWPVYPDRNHPGRGDLRRSGRAPGRTRAVNVDLVIGPKSATRSR